MPPLQLPRQQRVRRAVVGRPQVKVLPCGLPLLPPLAHDRDALEDIGALGRDAVVRVAAERVDPAAPVAHLARHLVHGLAHDAVALAVGQRVVLLQVQDVELDVAFHRGQRKAGRLAEPPRQAPLTLFFFFLEVPVSAVYIRENKRKSRAVAGAARLSWLAGRAVLVLVLVCLVD